jgi:hypothetical protein
MRQQSLHGVPVMVYDWKSWIIATWLSSSYYIHVQIFGALFWLQIWHIQYLNKTPTLLTMAGSIGTTTTSEHKLTVGRLVTWR